MQHGDDSDSHTEEHEIADDLGIEVFLENSCTLILELIDEDDDEECTSTTEGCSSNEREIVGTFVTLIYTFQVPESFGLLKCSSDIPFPAIEEYILNITCSGTFSP